ncbi:MAG TPA: hypothetical protein VJZ91_04880 [Blastocatellia bacterium]|nr:hypothetical protein [Blastocatellia bacterium]
MLSAVASIPYFFIANPLPGQSRWSLHMPATHDMHAHYNQMRSFYDGLSSGEIYPRWEADTNRGFGAPTTSFYPPGVYYVTAFCYWLKGDWTWALLLAQWLMAVGSGLALYVYARRAMRRGAALAAAVAYVVGPYHLIDQYQRGAIAELLGFVWMPLMLLAGERLMQKRGEGERRVADVMWRLRWTVLLAASYGAFVWSHPPTAYQFSLGFAVAMAVLAVTRRQWRGLPWIGAGFALGMALAAAYILPTVVEQPLVNSHNVAQDYPYHDSYVLARLGVYAGRANYFLDLIDRVWILNAALIAVMVVALLVIRPRVMRRRSPLKEQVIAWMALGVFALFMMTRLSYPLGRHIPKIEVGIFTWRMLGMSTLVVALLAGACGEVVTRMLKTRRRYEAGFAFAAAVWAVVGGAWFSLEEVVKPYSNGSPFVPEPEPFNYALLPRTAYGDIFRLPRVEPAELERGDGSVRVERWTPEHRAVRVEVNGDDRLLLRAFAFPGWAVRVDGKPASIESSRALRVRTASGEEALVRKLESPGWSPTVEGQPVQVIEEVALGDIAVPVEPGAHEVRLDYEATPARRAGNVLTLTSLAFIAASLIAIIAWRRHEQRTQ